MRKVNYLSASVISAVAMVASTVAAHAQNAIPVTSIKVGQTLGNITGIQSIVNFAINLFYYLGWVGVILGVGMAIFGLIYKLINTDSEDAMKTVQSYLTKAVLIVVAGILLVSSGWIITFVAGLIGVTSGLPNGTDTSPSAIIGN